MGFAGSQFHSGPGWIDFPLPPLPVLPPDPFADAGAQDIPFLSAITALEGAEDNALSAIPTGSITPPYVVQILATDGSGAIQLWALITSTAATGPGYQRPNDYASPSNTKVWVQLS